VLRPRSPLSLSPLAPSRRSSRGGRRVRSSTSCATCSSSRAVAARARPATKLRLSRQARPDTAHLSCSLVVARRPRLSVCTALAHSHSSESSQLLCTVARIAVYSVHGYPQPGPLFHFFYSCIRHLRMIHDVRKSRPPSPCACSMLMLHDGHHTTSGHSGPTRTFTHEGRDTSTASVRRTSVHSPTKTNDARTCTLPAGFASLNTHG
jgi:hypothetical protein